MFRSLLIANRGEIACRIIRTARRLGLRSVAVYSEADASAQHVRMADEALCIGPAAAVESYLCIARNVDAAMASGCDAIHPGYGFLAENAAFARTCDAAGIAFIGPGAAAIEAMGSKAAAKTLMQRAGLPLLPGYHGNAQDDASLMRAALASGLPVIVKPSAGGGGKGMVVVEHSTQLAAALAGSRRSALAAFGNGDLILERYLPAARHVEVQILADTLGHCVSLFDRDCSIQRRHQKLIEEAPAVAIPADLRDRMHRAAIDAARAVDYRGAGTIEFLYQDGEFYFLEMNTRLQVEHAVTEMISGLDIVEWQLRVACGEALPAELLAAAPLGHAIEVRVCAEDPGADFAPSSGRLQQLVWPAQDVGLRVDAGFAGGDEVPEYYDSLLGKIIARGEDRPAAIRRLTAALRELRITGVHSNASWLLAAITDNRFQNGIPATDFVAELGSAAPRDEFPQMALAVAWLCEQGIHNGERSSPWAQADGFRVGLPASQLRALRTAADTVLEFTLTRLQDGRWRVQQAGRSLSLRLRLAAGRWQVESEGRSQSFDALLADDWLHLWLPDSSIAVRLFEPRLASYQPAAAANQLSTPLPGVVTALLVKAGDDVEAGQTLLIVEAMKMEHAIKAPRAGRVDELRCQPGDRVTPGAPLITLASAATSAASDS